jgi:FtsZ-binding cell division protein ZapB
MTEIKNFRESVFAEIRKIHPKMSDLIKSIENLRNETKSLIEEKNTIDNDIQILMNQVEHTLTPEIEQLKYQWNNFAIITEKTNRVMFIDEQITRLFDEKDRMLKMLETKIEKDKSEILGYTDLASLSNFIEKRLSKWNYENSVKVNFDSSHLIFDITISGKSRSSYGKGKRSISYIACVLGLMDYCIEKEKDFPGFTIFDSPLTTFEEKKNQLSNEDEKISDSILKSFFQDLSNTTNDRQIIIFDNKEPMQPFREKINTIIFTGVKGNGRCGFFPA